MLEGKYLMYGDNLEDVDYVKKSCIVNNDTIENDQNRNTSKVDVLDSISNQDAIHVVIYEQKAPIGCGSMTMIENTFWFTNINVIEQYRRKRVGDFILRLLIEKADLMNATKIYIACTQTSQIFFHTFGFAPCDYPLEHKIQDNNNIQKDNNTHELYMNGVYWMCLDLSNYRMHQCCSK